MLVRVTADDDSVLTDQGNTPGSRAIFLEFGIESIDRLRAELSDGGYPIEKEWEDQNGTRFLSMPDPAGNTIHFFEGD